jgi:peptide/nickel transport system ATP-binding protein
MSQTLVGSPKDQIQGEGAISVRNLTVNFEQRSRFPRAKSSVVHAITDLSFNVVRNECLAVVGESGSGKTTLGRCIAKLQTPTSGQIMYEGRDINALKGEDLINYRRRVQMIFQDPYESLNPRQDVFTAISYTIRFLLGKNDPAELQKMVKAILEEVGLDPVVAMHRYPHQLSGGERQRVGIARAIACDPELLVADEPLTMLDAAQRLNVLRLLSDIKKRRGLTLFLITHDLASARLISNRTMLMYFGKQLEVGPTKTVLQRPFHPYLDLVKMATPSLSVTKGIVSEEATRLENPAEVGCIFRPRCRYATEICKTTEPKLLELSDNHYAACHNPLNMEKAGS